MQENKRLYQSLALVGSCLIFLFPIPIASGSQPYQFLFFYIISLEFSNLDILPQLFGILIVQYLFGRKIFKIVSRQDTPFEKLIQILLTVIAYFFMIGFIVYLINFLITMFKNI